MQSFLPHTLANNRAVSWAGPYPVLCRKRPTASLVSRKVLVPLLGQVTLCVLIQFIGFEAVQNEPWYDSLFWHWIPPLTYVGLFLRN
jgi:hypothetical protein